MRCCSEYEERAAWNVTVRMIIYVKYFDEINVLKLDRIIEFDCMVRATDLLT